MSIAWTQDVYSSNVQSIGYDQENKELIVTWNKGKRSIYSGVPEELAQQLANAPSVGSMMKMEIIPYYSHRYG